VQHAYGFFITLPSIVLFSGRVYRALRVVLAEEEGNVRRRLGELVWARGVIHFPLLIFLYESWWRVMVAAFRRLHFPHGVSGTERRQDESKTHTTVRCCSRVILAFALSHIIPFINRVLVIFSLFFSVIVISAKLVREAHFKRSRAS